MVKSQGPMELNRITSLLKRAISLPLEKVAGSFQLLLGLELKYKWRVKGPGSESVMLPLLGRGCIRGGVEELFDFLKSRLRQRKLHPGTVRRGLQLPETRCKKEVQSTILLQNLARKPAVPGKGWWIHGLRGYSEPRSAGWASSHY